MSDDTPVALLVDDEPLNLKHLAEVLDPDYRVRVASSGVRALELARSAPGPEVILLDVMMPEMDGYAVCAALKADPVTAEIPVIFITAKTDSESETAALRAGAVDFIHKPINPEVVRTRVSLQHELFRHRRHLEELVRRRTRELAHARDVAESANRAKTAFLGNASHEMRTPIHQISGLGHLLRRALTEPADLKRLDALEQVTRDLLGLVTNLLDFSQLEAGELILDSQPFDPRALLSNSLAGVESAAAAKGLRLHTSVAPEVPATLCGDGHRWGQVVGELLDNAIKFSDQGEIQIRLHACDQHGTHLHLHLEVSDQGIGLDPADIDRLFGRFETGDDSPTRRHGGLGLGLALCQRLVSLMSGEIRLTGSPGQGASVSVWVPLELAPSKNDSG